MRPILTLSVLVALAAGVIVGCKNSSSKETNKATSTTTQQPASDAEAEKKRLADQNASLEAEKRRLEEEQKRLQSELDKAKANAPTNAAATNYCGSIVRNNNSSFLACREYAGYDQTNITRLQQQCSGMGSTTGMPATGNPTWDQLIQMMNQNRAQSGTAGTWGTGGCPRTMQGAAAVATCKFIQGWSNTYWDVYYAPWTSANAKTDCESRRGIFSNP